MIIQKVKSEVWQEYINNRIPWYKDGVITDALGIQHRALGIAPLESNRELVGAYGEYIFGDRTPCIAISIPLGTAEYITGSFKKLEFFEKLHLGAMNITVHDKRSVHWVTLDSRARVITELYNMFTIEWINIGGEVFTEGGHVYLVSRDKIYQLKKIYGKRAPFSIKRLLDTENNGYECRDIIGAMLYEDLDKITSKEFSSDLTGLHLPKWDLVHSKEGSLAVSLT